MLEDHFLHRFLNPDSIAIVGASGNPFNVNYQLVNNLIITGFQGKIFPVNPKGEEILGLKTYKSVFDIQDEIDLVIISVPAKTVMNVVNELVLKKVKRVVLVTGGFAETGETGRRMQEDIARKFKDNGIRVMGPNVLSPVNSYHNLAISFFQLLALPRGNVSFIFQSGMYEPRFNWILSDFHLGVSKLLDLGNKMDVTEVDALEYLSEDPQTGAVFIHLEAIKGDGREFLRLVKHTTKSKPVVVLKGGRTEAGSKAAMSHTGSLVRGSDAVFDSALRQAGALKADTLDDFLYYAKAFSYLPSLKGNRIALATFPGGEAVLATDFAMQSGFRMASPGHKSYEQLKDVFPPWEIQLNPFDFGIVYTFHSFNNNHGLFAETMAVDDDVDCIAMQLPPLGIPIKPELFCPPLIKAKEKGKPLVLWPPHMLRLNDDVVTYLERNAIPVFPSAAIAIRCLAALNRYRVYSEAV